MSTFNLLICANCKMYYYYVLTIYAEINESNHAMFPYQK